MQVYNAEMGLRHVHGVVQHTNKNLKAFKVAVFNKGYYGSELMTIMGSDAYVTASASSAYQLAHTGYVVAESITSAQYYAKNVPHVPNLSAERNKRLWLGRMAQKCSTQDLWCYEELLSLRTKAPKKQPTKTQ